jgi:nitrogen fixation protein FixH
MKTLFLVLSLAVVAGAVFVAQSVDVTGKWILDVQTDAGSGTPTVT